ncbi:MAG TPA: T9SS type A sorting domain-containing protein, partial [Rhodothermales bacterium]|nr:T9SS type A sorting domain-containing protein [Rhodothermales bacterium]
DPADLAVVGPSGCEGGTERFYAAGAISRAVQPDGSVIPAQGVAYWNGTGWESLAGGMGTGATALAADAAGVYVGGRFSYVLDASGTSLPYNRLAYWRRGVGWEPIADLPADVQVYALALGPDGALYVGGALRVGTGPNGTPLMTPYLARRTGTQWTTLGGPAGDTLFGAGVNVLAFGPDGRLYAGGYFTSLQQPGGTTIPAQHVGVWDGTAWSALGTAPVWVTTLTFDGHGRPYVSGTPGTTAAMWNGTAWALQGTGVGNNVATLAFGPDGLLFVGGSFQQAGPYVSPALAAWDAQAATPAEPGAPDTPGALTLAVVPNPAQGPASFHFTLPEAAPVRLAVYDALGREVAVVTDAVLPAGSHEAALNAGRLAPGVYLARLTAGSETASRRLTVVR